jgi:hypothetical protein
MLHIKGSSWADEVGVETDGDPIHTSLAYCEGHKEQIAPGFGGKRTWIL